MWTRSLLKKNAWENLKNYYWPALGVSVVASFLGANSGGGGGGGGSSMSRMFEDSSESGGDVDPATVAGIVIVFLFVFILALAFAMAMRFFLGNVALCGRCKYFVTARNGDEAVGHLFDNFKNGNYMKTVKAMFFWYGEIWLWYLLFIVPGVIKAYEYALVPYLIAENPDMDSKRAKEISKQTMDGEKWNFAILQFSFIGWYLLGYLACCIGVIFVTPYQLATEAEFYMCMRAKMLSLGYTTEEELTGGFYNGFGEPAPQYNEPDFRNNAYGVSNNPYDNGGSYGTNPTGSYNTNPTGGYGANPTGNYGGMNTTSDGKVNLTKPTDPYQNPNDAYNGQMPGIDNFPDPTQNVDSGNDPNNPYNQ